MAHFAQVNDENTVLQVVVVDNAVIGDAQFPESEVLGQMYLSSLFPDVPKDRWIQTSYNGNFRVRYAGVGFTFVPNSTATPYGWFATPKWCNSFVFDDSVCDWVAPIPYPQDGKNYYWDCAGAQWVEVEQPS